MAKKPRIQSKRDARRASKVIHTADLVGVSPRQVQRVLAGNQDNESVMSVFMELKEREEKMIAEMREWMNSSKS